MSSPVANSGGSRSNSLRNAIFALCSLMLASVFIRVRLE